jgi:integrase
MNLATSNSFIGLRDLTITYLVREMDKPLKQVLELSREKILADRESALIGEHLVSNIPSFFCNYMHSRDNLFPGNEVLFPTKDGNQYYPNQFAKRIRKLLAQADASVKPYHPKKLSIKQYKKLVGLRFGLQRHRYQMILATALCANLGFRSSEVAGLKKSDIDFSLRVISLDDTKSQEDQESPLLSILFEPFRSFTERLSHNDHIFVNFSGNPWNRRHTRNAVQQYGEGLGIIDLTPRRLRASLGVTLARMGISPSLLAKVLRHKDPATALRYYNYREIEEVRHALEELDGLIARDKIELEGMINEFKGFYDQQEIDKSF